MAITLVRMNFAAVAAKIETVSGTDAIGGTPAAGDWIASDFTVDFDPVVVDNTELTGSLDKAPSIVGGLRPRIQLKLPLRGSGSAGTAPEWGRLLQCCTMTETITAVAVGAPTAATVGTTTSLTLVSPFLGTAQAYRGMPLLLSGDRTLTTGITDYSATRVATIGETMATAGSTGTLAQVPINVLYAPTSDGSLIKTCTLYFFADGFVWKFTGAQGSFSLELSTGGIAYLSFDLRAQMLAFTTAAMPTGWNSIVRQTPPRFVGGRCQLNRTLAQSRRLTLDAGVTVVLPDNPEAAEGYDPAIPTARASKGTIDPLMNTTGSVALYTAFKQGTQMPLMAMLGASAGNRFLVTAPLAKAVSFKPGAIDGLGKHDIAFNCEGADAALFLASF